MTNDDQSPEERLARQIQQLLKPIPDDRADASRLDELRRIFARLYQEGELGGENSLNKQLSASEQKWKSFLRGSFAKFRSQLSQRIWNGKRTAVRTFWGVVASSPKSVLVGGQKDSQKSRELQQQKALMLDESILLQWVQAMSRVPVWDQSIQHMVQAEFLVPYRDVQYHVMSNVADVAASLLQKSKSMKEEDAALQAERLIQILMMIPLVETQDDLESQQVYLFAPPADAVPEEQEIDENDDSDDEDEEEESTADSDEDSTEEGSPKKKRKLEETVPRSRFSVQRLKAHQKQWSKAWLAVLRLECLPKHCLKRALQFLPSRVLPVVGRPLMFADFFMNAYGNDESGILPILALDGLFYLMTEHGLEYPNYYKQLYKTIQPNLFSVKYKTRFFQLLDKSVSRNDLLPAHIVAALGKRLLRCCLQAPPPGILIALVLVSNWFRQHSETSCLLHRADTDEIHDKYNATTDDPEQANALQSSLWELSALSKHYYPAVATMARAVGTPDEAKLPLHSLDDYVQITYKTLLEQERKRQKKPNNQKKGGKSSTPLTFRPPNSGLFDPSDVFSSFMTLPKKTTSEVDHRK